MKLLSWFSMPLLKFKFINLLLTTITAIFNTSFSSWNSDSYNPSQSMATAQIFIDKRHDFFDKGRLQIEQEIKELEEESSQPILTIESGKIQWQNISCKEGGFSIRMPGVNITEEIEIFENEKGKIRFQVFVTHPASARFMVAYSEILNSKQLVNKQNILSNLQNKIVDVTGFKLSSDRSYNLGDILGREFILKNDTETIIFRIYLAGKRLYLLGASPIEKDNEIAGAVFIFLDSFKLN